MDNERTRQKESRGYINSTDSVICLSHRSQRIILRDIQMERVRDRQSNIKKDRKRSSKMYSRVSQKKNPKIREKVFLQLLDWGMNKIKKKTNIISNSTSLKLSFAYCHGILLPTVPEIAV